MTPAWAAGVTGVPAARIEQAAEWWGTAATGMLLHARGIEQQSKGTENVLAAINLGLATGKFGKPGCGVTTITGQGNGQGGREHGHKCDQLPGNRDITNPEHRAHVASVWGCPDDDIPGKGITAQEIIEAIHAGEIKGLLSICFNPAVSAPNTDADGRGVRPAGVLRRHRLLPLRVGAPRRPRAARFAARGGRGHVHDGRGPHRQDQQGGRSAGRGPQVDWAILCDIARRLGKGQYFEYENTEQIFEELRLASAGGTADYRGATWPRIEDEMGLFWPVPRRGSPRHATTVRGRPLLPPRRPGPLPRRPVPRVRRGGRRRVPDLADHRPGREPVPVRDADPAHRRSRRPVPGAAVRDAPAPRRAHRRRRRRPRHRRRRGAGR